MNAYEFVQGAFAGAKSAFGGISRGGGTKAVASGVWDILKKGYNGRSVFNGMAIGVGGGLVYNTANNAIDHRNIFSGAAGAAFKGGLFGASLGLAHGYGTYFRGLNAAERTAATAASRTVAAAREARQATISTARANEQAAMAAAEYSSAAGPGAEEYSRTPSLFSNRNTRRAARRNARSSGLVTRVTGPDIPTSHHIHMTSTPVSRPMLAPPAPATPMP